MGDPVKFLDSSYRVGGGVVEGWREGGGIMKERGKVVIGRSDVHYIP